MLSPDGIKLAAAVVAVASLVVAMLTVSAYHSQRAVSVETFFVAAGLLALIVQTSVTPTRRGPFKSLLLPRLPIGGGGGIMHQRESFQDATAPAPPAAKPAPAPAPAPAAAAAAAAPASGTPTPTPAPATAPARPPPDNGTADLPSGGLAVFVTAFSAQSYSGSGKTWRNIALPTPVGAGDRQSCPDSKNDSRDFAFSTVPSFKPDSGFTTSSNPLVGPMCHMLGIDANQPFSISLVFQPSGDLPRDEDVELVALYANTKGNNGVRLSLRSTDAMEASGRLAAKMTLQIGTAEASSGAFAFDARRRYIVTAIRDRVGAKVLVVDLDAPTYASTQVLGDNSAAGVGEAIRLSNVEMQINPGGKWNVMLASVLLYGRALGEMDVGALYVHFRAKYQHFDPAAQRMAALEAARRKATECPFDAKTCAACGEVKDWSSSSDGAITAGKDCTSAIHLFCTANPKHPRCTCWDPDGKAYATTACQAYRGAFSGQAEVDAAALKAWRARALECPAAQAQADVAKEEALKQQQHQHQQQATLSPENINAIASLVRVLREPGHTASHEGGCSDPTHVHEHDHTKTCRHKHKHKHHHKHGDRDRDRDRDHDDDDHDDRSFWSKLWSW